MAKTLKLSVTLLLSIALLAGIFACNGNGAEAPAAEAPAAEAPAAETPAAEAPAAEAPAAEAPVGGAAATFSPNFILDPSQIPQEKLDTTLYIAISVRGLENPYIATKNEGMMMFSRWLTEIGQAHEYQVLDSGGSNDREVDNMRQFGIRAGGNAIAYADPNENAIAFPLAEAIAESGGFIGTAWNKPDDVGPMDLTPNWVIHTSPDNEASGYAIAVEMFNAMGGSGKIFVIEGMLGNTAAIDRATGLDRALAEFPDIEVVGRDTGNWATDEAMTLTETWLNMHPDVGGIWCANDNMAMGAIQALTLAGLEGQVYVVGIDATTDMVESIRDGLALATVSSNGFLQAGYTLAITYAAWTGLLDVNAMPPDFREFATPSMLILQDNAEEFLTLVPSFDFTNIFYARES